jgi:hypothetical protein
MVCFLRFGIVSGRPWTRAGRPAPQRRAGRIPERQVGCLDRFKTQSIEGFDGPAIAKLTTIKVHGFLPGYPRTICYAVELITLDA